MYKGPKVFCLTYFNTNGMSQNPNWVVVFKGLISTHHLMCYGNEVNISTHHLMCYGNEVKLKARHIKKVWINFLLCDIVSQILHSRVFRGYDKYHYLKLAKKMCHSVSANPRVSFLVKNKLTCLVYPFFIIKSVTIRPAFKFSLCPERSFNQTTVFLRLIFFFFRYSNTTSPLLTVFFQRFTQYLASSNSNFQLSNYLDKSGVQGQFFV